MEQEHGEEGLNFVAPETGTDVEQGEKDEGKFEIAGTEVNIGDRIRITEKEAKYTFGLHTNVEEATFEGVQTFGQFQHVMLSEIKHLDKDATAANGSIPIGEIAKVEII